MNFDSVNYCFLLQDFIYAAAAGFVAGGINQFLTVFLYGRKTLVWIRDMLAGFIFSVVVFSYVVSFANYPDIRIYHILGAFAGFLSFDYKFSTIFHKIFEKILTAVKNKMLCAFEKAATTVGVLYEKNRQKHKKGQTGAENTDLKNNNNWVYNL